ncbi:hypothetical protein DFJ63DRAFT_61063 [Scheffersomyces coipomensis]|uniref:uncharacterized protein n=1 Tax=Scheffersomyces coipomensis TaxID=1788519 RepID=UPI00315CEED0
MNLPPSSPVDNNYLIPSSPMSTTSPLHSQLQSQSQIRQTTIHSPKMLSSSSPTGSKSPTSGPSNVLDDIHNNQQRRRNQLYKPFSSSSSPMEVGSYSAYSPHNQQYHLISPLRTKHHQQQQPHHLRANMRNKHNKMKFIRDQYIQDKLELQRDKYHEFQFRDDLNREYEQEYHQVTQGLDLDTLLNDEEEEQKYVKPDRLVNVQIQNGFEDEDYEAYIADYENDLEDYGIQQDLEIVDMLKEMDLSSNHPH